MGGQAMWQVMVGLCIGVARAAAPAAAGPATLWSGGGVTVYANFSYTAQLGEAGGSNDHRLVNGWYGLMCGGEVLTLVPTGHTMTSVAHRVLGVGSSLTVQLVGLAKSAGPCNATQMTATFKHFPAHAAVLFEQSFPKGIANTTGRDPYAINSSNPAPAGKCSLENNTDYPGADIRYLSNVTDVGVCCAACYAEPKCVAFSLMGAKDSGKPWAGRCYLKHAVGRREQYATHISGQVPGRAPGPPPPGPPPPRPGGMPTLPPGRVSAFPLFASPLHSGQYSYLTWAGMFFPAHWGTSGGTNDGAPIVLVDNKVQHGDGVVLSTYDEHFTSGCHLSEYGFGCGITTEVGMIESSYSCTSLTHPGGGGVTNITMAWGKFLQTVHNSSRSLAKTDVVTNKIGYWTDNEAYYDWYHWFPNVNRDGAPQDVLLAIDAELRSKGVHAHYYQLDAYWYHLQIKPGYCVVNWTAVQDQFPKGLAWLAGKLNKPLMLYSDTWCNNTVYRKERGGNWSFMDADPIHISWFDGNVANVVPEDAISFYSYLLGEAGEKEQGMGAFEVDFLNYNFQLYARFRSEPGAHARWLEGMNGAAMAAGVSIQYCMTLPQQLINAVQLESVTSTRVSGDGGRPYTNGAPGQLLAGALGVRPFKDNAWTSGAYPKGYADIVGSVLTMGPVGLADELNFTNSTLASMACTADGTLLHPNRPATPVDATFLPSAPRGSLIVANYGPAGDTDTVFWVAAANNINWQLSANDLWPLPANGVSLQIWLTGPPCLEGANASNCLSRFGAGIPAPVSAGAETSELYHIAPVLSERWVLLGEASKIIPVSSSRTLRVTASETRLTVNVMGAEGEEVAMLAARVAGRRSEGRILSSSVTIGASGTASIVFAE